MNDTERTIRKYLARSAGTCNHLSDHVMRKFVGMVEREEQTLDDFRRIGGHQLAVMVSNALKRFGRVR